MELKFEKAGCACLETVLQEIQNQEQTQELRLSDDMPDIGRVLAVWGQPILRGKEWRTGQAIASGGMIVWVLYAPEDGSEERCLETWVQFQLRWDIPDDKSDGAFRIRWFPRLIDARSVSPRKIMLRCGIAALAEASVPMHADVSKPQDVPPDVQLLTGNYPVRLPKEAGEKNFLIDEELPLPDTTSRPEKILCYRMTPVVTDRKVMTNKVVFRGDGNLHVLYRGENGKIQVFDAQLPFSQYSDLEGEYSPDAQADITPLVTNLEMDLSEEGRLRLKAGISGQYRVTDKENLELIQDAYSTSRELSMEWEDLDLPAILDERRENIYAEQMIPGDASEIVDVSVLPDYPRQQREENGMKLNHNAAIQVLYYGADGKLSSGTGRWEEISNLETGDNSRVLAEPVFAGAPQASVAGNGIQVRNELGMDICMVSRCPVACVSSIELGETRKPDANRPSLILRRKGSDSLWSIAKANATTVDAIRKANKLQEEPASGQMLLIPVGP